MIVWNASSRLVLQFAIGIAESPIGKSSKVKTVLPLFVLVACLQPAHAEQADREKVDQIYQSFVDRFRETEGQGWSRSLEEQA